VTSQYKGRIRTLEQRRQKGILSKPDRKEKSADDPTNKSIKLANTLKRRMKTHSSTTLNVLD
jgi:hypothetical protein